MSEINTTAAEIWKVLSPINVNDQTDVKEVNGKNFSYLSWAWAWGVLMKHYPDAEFEFLAEEHLNESVVREKQGQNWAILKGRTTMVGVRMNIRGVERSMWLPVMNAKNNAQIDPCMRSISDTRMRCLVKCIALYGLGYYIYAGEDIPQAEGEAAAADKNGSKKKEDSTSKGGSAENEHARVVRESVSVFMTECNDVSSLEKFWLANKEPLAKVKRECPEAFDGLVALFKQAREKMTESK